MKVNTMLFDVSTLFEISAMKMAIVWAFTFVLVIYAITFIALFILPSIVRSTRLLKVLLAILMPIGSVSVFLCAYETISEYVILTMLIAYVILYLYFLISTIQTQRKVNKDARKMMDQREGTTEHFW